MFCRLVGGPGQCELWGQLPTFPPALPVAEAIFLELHAEVKCLERTIAYARLKQAKVRRQQAPRLIFQDIARDRPAPVDMLLDQSTATVFEVRPEDCSVLVDHLS